MQNPSLPYVLPFVVFLVLLGLEPYNPLPKEVEYPLRVAVLAGLVWLVSRPALDFRVRRWTGSVLLGVGVFAIWVAPDMLVPGWRQHWLFRNAVTGAGTAGDLDYGAMHGAAILFRAIRAVILVPVIEELFWRGWLMRWLAKPDFQSVPLGTYAPLAFWGSAVLFALEHGRYWEVGLAAGVLYNWWMLRARSLGDCILAHAVTNGCLTALVLVSGRWEYW